MIMVVIIGLTSASAIRNATSGERVTNNVRMQGMAQQYAEAALRFCEIEVRKGSADRVAKLRDINIALTNYVVGQASFQVSPAPWEMTTTWVGVGVAGDASNSKYTLDEAQIKSVNSSITPANRPQCVAEKQQMQDLQWAWVITARGFSPDYSFDAGTGQTKSGSVVWLQSILI